MKRRGICGIGMSAVIGPVLLFLGGAGVHTPAAFGQAAVPQAPPEIQTTPTDWAPRSRVGVAAMVAGGFGDFSNGNIRSATDLGGSWNVRATSGTRLPFAWELGYLGGVNGIEGVGFEDDAYMLRTTIEGALRFNAPIVLGSSMMSPFALAGVGWTRYDTYNTIQALITQDELQDDQLTTPLGAGLAFYHRGFTADARFTYRFAFDDDLFGDQDMSTWNVSFGLGAEF